MPELTIVQAVNDALRTEMKLDKNVLVMGEDVGVDGGVFRATDGLIKTFGDNRVIDTPLAEAGIIGSAIGMAVYGLKPVAEIQFSGFIYPGFDQIISHAARIRTRSRGRFTCPLVIRSPYSGGIKALEHHSESMEAIYSHIPGLKVVIPSTPYDTKGLLISAIRDPDPVLFLEPKKIYRSVKQEVPEKAYTIPIGKASIVKQGNDVTIISWGAMMQVVRRLQLDVDAEIIDLRTISPLDERTIIDSVKKTGRCVIVHEAPRNCGVGAEIIARINDNILSDLKAPVERVTGFDTIVPLAKLENNYFPNAERINAAIEKVMKS